MPTLRFFLPSSYLVLGILTVSCFAGCDKQNTVEAPAKYEAPPKGMSIQGQGGEGKAKTKAAVKDTRGEARQPE